MPLDPIEARIKCPYFIRSSEYSISCEALAEGTDNVSIKFATRYRRDCYARRHCEQINDCTPLCPIRKWLDEKYG